MDEQREGSGPLGQVRAQCEDLIVHEGRTRGGPGKSKYFRWCWDGQTLHIHRENQNHQHDEFPRAELEEILKDLEGQFRSGWFPLANNVEKMSKRTEKPGLGMTILRNRPGRDETMHAQASTARAP